MRNNTTTGPEADGRQNLGGRYGKIGISAVAAALMCIRGVEHRDQLPESPAAGRRNNSSIDGRDRARKNQQKSFD